MSLSHFNAALIGRERTGTGGEKKQEKKNGHRQVVRGGVRDVLKISISKRCPQEKDEPQ